MAAVTICSDFGAPKTKYDTVSPSIDYAKAFNYVDHNKLWKILQVMGIPDHLTCLLRNLCAGQEAKLELDIEQQTGSKSGKEYVKAVYIVTLLI